MPSASPPAEDEPTSDIEVDEDDQLAPPDPATVSQYLAHLHAHNNDVRAHLSGSPQTTDHRLSASYFAPSAFWTAKEKDLFFHALSVHSRLRPDLIAEEIGTKTLADVCAYIDMLQEGLKTAGDEAAAQVIPEYLDFESVPREDFPTAYEVSDEWVKFEDAVAEAAILQEATLVAEALQKAHDEEAHQYQLQIRARKGTAKLADNTRDREGERTRNKQFKEWLKEKEKVWRMEDALNSMDIALMKAADNVIREREEARSLQQDELDGSQEGASLPVLPVAQAEQAHGDLVSPLAQLPKVVDDFDEELIDPSLRASSAPTAVQTPQPDDHVRPHTPEPLALNPHDHFRPRTPPFMHLQPTDSSSTLFDADPSTPSVAGSSAPPPSEADAQLSPAARRRLYKRMYMRRKRAEKTGGAVDPSAARLKPGRKPLPLPHQAAAPDAPTRHPRASGKASQAKKKGELGAVGVDAEWFEQECLDLFHFGALHRLMRTYQGLHDVADAVASQISIHTLRLLREELVQFIFRVVQHAVISREQEMKAKVHTKVWRIAENHGVTAANVAHAVSLLGLEHPDKKSHFEALLPRLGLTEEDFINSEDDEQEQEPEPEPDPAPAKQSKGKGKQKAKAQPDDDIESEDEIVPRTLPPLLQDVPVHRLVYPPFVRLPGASTGPSDSLQSYIPWAHGLNIDDHDASDSSDEDDADAHDAAEAHDLLQEAELDHRDRAAAKAHEDALLAAFGRAAPARTITDDQGTWDVSRTELWPRRVPGAGGRKRQRAVARGEGRKKKKFKTAEFIEDSEEEGVGEADAAPGRQDGPGWGGESGHEDD
ncbi:hypothetical protein PsYK624_108970 [Phanerochaete sordida]|uniref:Uncharacterized protein n=1 Tax=Phanerochaete sordida TaxID=48140 RepID=A0A9P3GH66_9APHY|nr:hypothetical protein PsYK624_108970 [Phanerochaete sordida]